MFHLQHPSHIFRRSATFRLHLDCGLPGSEAHSAGPLPGGSPVVSCCWLDGFRSLKVLSVNSCRPSCNHCSLACLYQTSHHRSFVLLPMDFFLSTWVSFKQSQHRFSLFRLQLEVVQLPGFTRLGDVPQAFKCLPPETRCAPEAGGNCRPGYSGPLCSAAFLSGLPCRSAGGLDIVTQILGGLELMVTRVEKYLHGCKWCKTFLIFSIQVHFTGRGQNSSTRKASIPS